MNNLIPWSMMLLTSVASWALPAIDIAVIDRTALEMSSDDLLQNKPIALDSSITQVPKDSEFSLTDATGPDTPALSNRWGGGTQEPVLRWDLGSLGQGGRTLTVIKVFIDSQSPSSSGAYFKFAAHFLGKGWQDITGYIAVDVPKTVFGTNMFKVVTITFPAGEVAGFDALRLYDGKATHGYSTSTTFVEVDAFSTPGNR
mgnify:CR=1 FL=1